MERELSLRIAERYANGSRAVRGYVAGKLRSDPVASSVLAIGRASSLGAVCDVGCGRGQMGVLLLEAGVATSVRGWDWDAEKVAAAARAAEGLDARFEQGDVREHPIPPCDTVLLVDVLHYLTPEEQDALLARAATAARRHVLVRELDPDRGWRSAVTRLQESITTGLRYNEGARLVFRAIGEITAPLERAGFRTSVAPAWGSTPFANVLVHAQRD